MSNPEILDNGRIRLYHGDCRDILPHIGPVDAVVTDPPYGIYKCGGKWGHKGSLEWDRQIHDISPLLKLGKCQIIWGGNYYPLPPPRGWLVWYKRDAVPSAADCELAWTSFDMNIKLIDQTIAATNAERLGHPTQKPVRVMRWVLGFLPPLCGVVLDPYMGSGTTGVACIQTGRSFVGIEQNAEFFHMAVNRLAKEVALRDGKGELFK